MAIESHWEVDPANEAQVWDRLIGKPAEDAEETARQVDIILKDIPFGVRCLEVGAGVGRLMKEIAGRAVFTEVHGIDSSIAMIAIGQGYLGGAGELTLTDGQHTPYPDHWFDFVYSFTVMQHQRSLALIHRNLREVCRVLKPTCLCRIQSVLAKPGASPNNFTEYDGRVMSSVREFEEMFVNAGLIPEKAEVGLTHPEHVWITARRP